jgi:hypothetical protein
VLLLLANPFQQSSNVPSMKLLMPLPAARGPLAASSLSAKKNLAKYFTGELNVLGVCRGPTLHALRRKPHA